MSNFTSRRKRNQPRRNVGISCSFEQFAAPHMLVDGYCSILNISRSLGAGIKIVNEHKLYEFLSNLHVQFKTPISINKVHNNTYIF